MFSVVEECPIFGVPLEKACERHKSHDGVPIPVIVRLCIDYIEEHGINSIVVNQNRSWNERVTFTGLMQEGIYRSSGVKSKQTKLRNAFSTRRPSVNLGDYEPAVVASVLKQFLRELPDPVLTPQLMPRFEKVAN